MRPSCTLPSSRLVRTRLLGIAYRTEPGLDTTATFLLHLLHPRHWVVADRRELLVPATQGLIVLHALAW